MSMLKRQRELRKAEKAARKRAKRHGLHEEGSTEPRPTVRMADFLGSGTPENDHPGEESDERNGSGQMEEEPG
jgi:hypothetical protein